MLVPIFSCMGTIRIQGFLMKIASMGWGKMPLAGLLAGFIMLGATGSARAALGADAKSIESDAAAMQGTMASQEVAPTAAPAGSYSVKSFVTPAGVTVREYVAPSGAIFGIAWQGHRPPDLSILLGSYYSEYTSAEALKTHRDMHRSVTRGPNSVVVMAGHMGHVVGHAYVASLAPAGVDPKAVVK
jgi:uncharacterized protein DUF2844